MQDHNTAHSTTLLRAYLFCMIVLAVMFCVVVVVNSTYTSRVLEREKALVDTLLPQLDSAYQLTAATAQLQSQGLLLRAATTVKELEVRRQQLRTNITLMQRSVVELASADRPLRTGVAESIDDISLVSNQLADIKLQQIASQDFLSKETVQQLGSMQDFNKDIQQRLVTLTNELLDNEEQLLEIIESNDNDSDRIKRVEQNFAAHESINLSIQDALLFIQDLVSLAALIERVPLLSDTESVTVAEQNRDLLLRALVGRSIYMDPDDGASPLLLTLRELRDRLISEDNVFTLKKNVLTQDVSQSSQWLLLRQKSDIVLAETEQLRSDTRSNVLTQTRKTLEGLDRFRIALLIVSALIFLGLAAMSYWLLYRKTVLPLLEITRQLDNVGSERYPVQAQQYFLKELSTLSSAMQQLDTAQKAMIAQDERLQGINRDLKRVNEELEQFAHVASHDLQEPLRKLQQFSDLLEEDYIDKLDDDGLFFLKTIRTSAQRMSRLITETLEYSRAGSSNQLLEPVDLSELLRQLRDEMALAIEEAQADIHIDELPRVNANGLGMAQLFRNLLLNAVKYRKPDQPACISVVAIRCQEFICVQVADKGVGIDEKYLERIFVPFERMHSGSVQGTGLGLAICRKVCDSHGWQFTVESTLGVGTTFIIQIPLSSVLD